MKLGICDYGIGGLGVFKNVSIKSDLDILYFSDSGYIPYGKLSVTDLKERLSLVFSFMRSKGVTHIAVACNAASSVLIDNDDDKLTHIISHAVSMIKGLNIKEIGIVGGARTIKSNCYGKELDRIKTQQRIAQELSIKIENGDLNSNELLNDIETIFTPLKSLDYILLGCTHYPVISKLIAEFCPTSTLLDPSLKMSNWILQNWDAKNGSSNTEWYTTGSCEKMRNASKKAFDVEMETITKVKLT